MVLEGEHNCRPKEQKY